MAENCVGFCEEMLEIVKSEVLFPETNDNPDITDAPQLLGEGSSTTFAGQSRDDANAVHSCEEIEKSNLEGSLDFQQCWIKQESNEAFTEEDSNSEVESAPESFPKVVRPKTPYCDICVKKFMTHNYLRKHMRSIHGPKSAFPCSECNEAFKSLYRLKIHLKNQHFIKASFQCSFCKESFQLAKDLNHHMKENHKTVFCSPCGKIFNGNEVLKEHVNLYHNTEEFRKCQVCGKTYAGLDAYSQHDKQHTGVGDKPFTCCICSKVFTYERLLLFHMSTHSKTRPYNCDLCDAPFCTPYLLAGHRYTYHNIKLKCDRCDKEFRTNTALKKHGLTHDANLYQCDICGKSFKNDTALLNHKSTHTTTTNTHNCEHCDNVFPTVVALRSHGFYFHSSNEHKTE